MSMSMSIKKKKFSNDKLTISISFQVLNNFDVFLTPYSFQFNYFCLSIQFQCNTQYKFKNKAD